MPASSSRSILIPALLLGGCATDTGGRYPSLAPRAIERQSFAEPVRATLPVTPDPALDAEIAEQDAALTKLVAGYDAAAALAEHRVAAARSATVGSEPWLAGQAALATLDDWRARTTALAAALEQRGSARAARLDPPYPPLQALIDRAGAEAQRQAGRSEQFQTALPPA